MIIFTLQVFGIAVAKVINTDLKYSLFKPAAMIADPNIELFLKQSAVIEHICSNYCIQKKFLLFLYVQLL